MAPNPAHPLDHPVWAALGTQHRGFALGEGVARRYPAQVAPFAAMATHAPASFQALARLLVPGETVALVLAEDVTPPATFEILLTKVIDQMVRQAPPAPRGEPGAEGPAASVLAVLGPEDVTAMMALVELTKPGPFLPRTHELGTYLGVREGDRLAAMAGERMRLDGFTEISAVCTHPDHRGRGYARTLMTALIKAVEARGETPFLHVLSDNQAAIGLYRELGFALRRTVRFTVLRLA